MIRKFANANGRLYELLKPPMKIGTRPRSPKSILFRDDYYKDPVGDLDLELLSKVENKFGKVYSKVLNNTPLDGQAGAAFVDWVSAMLVRTGLMEESITSLIANHSEDLARNTDAFKSIANLARMCQFTAYQDLFTRKQWVWKIKSFSSSDQDIVITDHPVCTSGCAQRKDFSVTLPVSKKAIFFGGYTETTKKMALVKPEQVNQFLYGWANRSVFASTRETLESITESLRYQEKINPALYEKSSLPYFGHTLRLAQIVDADLQNKKIPDEIQSFIESYGSPVWEQDR